MDLMVIGCRADITYELLNSAFPLRMPSLWGRGTTRPSRAWRKDSTISLALAPAYAYGVKDKTFRMGLMYAHALSMTTAFVGLLNETKRQR